VVAFEPVDTPEVVVARKLVHSDQPVVAYIGRGAAVAAVAPGSVACKQAVGAAAVQSGDEAKYGLTVLVEHEVGSAGLQSALQQPGRRIANEDKN
jgi:hypothetical protein